MDKMEIYAKFKRAIKDTCLLVFTEAWLGGPDQDSELLLIGFGSPICMDRSPGITGKSRGGGVCFSKCKLQIPTAVLHASVHTFPQAEQSVVSQLIRDIKYKLDSLCPEAPKFVLGILITAI